MFSKPDADIIYGKVLSSFFEGRNRPNLAKTHGMIYYSYSDRYWAPNGRTYSPPLLLREQSVR